MVAAAGLEPATSLSYSKRCLVIYYIRIQGALSAELRRNQNKLAFLSTPKSTAFYFTSHLFGLILYLLKFWRQLFKPIDKP